MTRLALLTVTLACMLAALAAADPRVPHPGAGAAAPGPRPRAATSRLPHAHLARAAPAAHASSAAPTVRVDARHDASRGRRPEYSVPPAPSLVVDATGYAYTIPAALRRKGVRHPTHLNVLIDREHGYLVRWRPGRVVLDARSLKPMAGRKRFAGFQRGQKVVLGVGVAMRAKGQLRFVPLWAGVVNVR